MNEESVIPHSLVGIYDLHTRVYRRGEDQAVVLLGPTGASAAILHPWRWEGVPYREHVEPVTEKAEAGLHNILSHSTGIAHGLTTLGELLVWCSMRPTPQVVVQVYAHDECSGDTYEHWPRWDAQPIRDTADERTICIVNRWLVRECLQRLIEDGAKSGRVVHLALYKRYGGHVLRMTSASTEIVIMSARPDPGDGHDGMPGGWTR